MGRIASAAAANKQLLFHYFRSKDGLYDAAVSRVFSGAPTTGETTATPPEVLKGLVAGLAMWFARNPGAAVAVTECARQQVMPEAAVATVAAWRSRVSASLRSALDEGQRQGHFRDDIDTQAIVELVVGAVVGHALIGRSMPGGAPTQSTFAPLLSQLVADYAAWR
jgi:AcrR family transcriptional regulator